MAGSTGNEAAPAAATSLELAGQALLDSEEIVRRILSHLGTKDVGAVACASRRFSGRGFAWHETALWSAGRMWHATVDLLGSSAELCARFLFTAGASEAPTAPTPTAPTAESPGQALLFNDDIVPLILSQLGLEEVGVAACVCRRFGGWPSGVARQELQRRSVASPLALLVEADRTCGRARTMARAIRNASNDDAKTMDLAIGLCDLLVKLHGMGGATVLGGVLRLVGDEATCDALVGLLRSNAATPLKSTNLLGFAGSVFAAGPRGAALLLIWTLIRAAPAGARERLLTTRRARRIRRAPAIAQQRRVDRRGDDRLARRPASRPIRLGAQGGVRGKG